MIVTLDIPDKAIDKLKTRYPEPKEWITNIVKSELKSIDLDTLEQAKQAQIETINQDFKTQVDAIKEIAIT